MRHKTVPTV